MKFVRRFTQFVGVLVLISGLSLIGAVALYEADAVDEIINNTDSFIDTFVEPSADDVTVPQVTTTNAQGSRKAKLKVGTSFAVLHIPRLNRKWQINEGVRPSDIKSKPGHYPNSALPGQTGNFSIAGHRVRSIFYNIDHLRNGDEIIVQYRGKTYVYKVFKRYVVNPTDVWVIAPNLRSGGEPTRKLLTITTCNKKADGGNRFREVVHAELVE